MAHSKNFAKVETYYSIHMWSEEKVRNAVVKGWITPEEFQEITGKEYE